MNQVTLVGRIVQNPELSELSDGNVVSKFNLAVDRYYGHQMREEKRGEGKVTADFPRIAVWGKTAFNAAKYLQKGSLVSISGKVSTSSFESAGERKYSTEIIADKIEYLNISKKDC